MNSKVKYREKLAYGLGYLGMGLENGCVLGYLTFFATDVLYIKAAIIGIVILLPKILDVLTDILLINLVDRTDTRWGKYKPWILSGIPLALCLCLIFSAPQFLTTQTQNLLWISVIYFITTPIFETMYWCPYLTLGTVISADSNDRLDLASMRSVFEQISNLIVAASCMPLVLRFGETYHDPTGWRIAAVVYAVLGILFTLICFFGVKERVKVDNTNKNGERLRLKEKLGALRHNPPMFKALAIMVVLFLPWYGYSTLFSYFCINVLGHEEWIAPLSLIGIGIAVLAAILASRLGRHFEKRQLIGTGAVMMVLAGAWIIFARSFLSMIGFFLLKDIGLVLIYVCSISYMPDLAAYTHWKTGLDVTGILNASVSAFQKLAAALGAYLATVVLALGHYDATLDVQSDFTLHALRWGIVISFIVAGALIFLCNHAFRELDRDQLALYTPAEQQEEVNA